MATVNIYRCAYIHESEDDATIKFSGWSQEDGLDEVEANLMAVNPPKDGSPGGIPPTILGWEKMELDTEPL